MNKEEITTYIELNSNGITLSGDTKFLERENKVFINKHEITDIDTFFKVAEENTKLQQENEKLKLNHKQLKDIEKTMMCNSRLIQENKQLKEDIKVLFEENSNKEQLIQEQIRRIDMCCRDIDEVLIYNDFSDTTSGIGNIPKDLKNILKGEENGK